MKETHLSYNAGGYVYLPEIDVGGFQAAKQATVVTTVSAFQANILKAYLRKRQKLRVIYRSVDLLGIADAERPLSGSIQFIHVGCAHPVSDQTTLLKIIDADLRGAGPAPEDHEAST